MMATKMMTTGIVAALTVSILAQPTPSDESFHTWHPQAYGDVRAPCPMLNTLANHGFLPHDGKNIDAKTTKDALFDALHINETLGQFLFDFAITTSPKKNATTFDLDNLARHNILEHDASLSRQDAYFGDPQPFNAVVFAETRSYWKTPIINVQQAADARVARLITSNTTNPEFSLSELGAGFSVGETAAYIFVLGDKYNGTVGRRVVEYLFENERLPVELGWQRPNEPILLEDLYRMMDMVTNATVGSLKMRKM